MGFVHNGIYQSAPLCSSVLLQVPADCKHVFFFCFSAVEQLQVRIFLSNWLLLFMLLICGCKSFLLGGSSYVKSFFLGGVPHALI